MSLKFDRTRPDYIYADGTYTFPGGAGATAMTVNLWVYIDTQPAAATSILVDKVTAGAGQHCFSCRLLGANSQPDFYVWNEDNLNARAAAGNGAGGALQLATATWYMYTMTANISGAVLSAKNYINGTRRDNLSGGSNTTRSNSVNLGSNAYGTQLGKWVVDNNYPFDGRLEDVAIWDRVLSDAEILALYQGRFRANHKAFLGGLKMYWPLDNPFTGMMTANEASIINHTPFYSAAKVIPEDAHEPTWSAATPGLSYLSGPTVNAPAAGGNVVLFRRRIEAA